MAADRFTEVYTKLANLVVTRAGLVTPAPDGTAALVRWNNFVQLLGAFPYPGKPPNANTESFPTLYLDQASGSDTAFSADATFSTFSDTFDPDLNEWSEVVTQNYLFTVYGPDLRLPPMNKILTELLVSIRRGGPRLGLGYALVQDKLTIQHGVANASDERSGGQARRVARLQIPVQMTFESNELLGM